MPGNSRDYPLCDVAQYWTIYDLPGAPGTTWIYAHAQPGMFLPIFLTADFDRWSRPPGPRGHAPA